MLRGTTSSMWCMGCLIHPLGEGGVQSPANILNRMGRHSFIFRRGKEEGSTNQTLPRCPRFKSVLFFLLPPVCLPCFSKANPELLEGSKNISDVVNMLHLKCKCLIDAYTKHRCCFSSGVICLRVVQMLSVVQKWEKCCHRNAFL